MWALACRNWVSNDEVPADLDPALQSSPRRLSLESGEPGTPVLDPAPQHLIEPPKRCIPSVVGTATEAFPRHDQGESTILSPGARWRSSRDPICRGVMFLTPLVLAITAVVPGARFTVLRVVWRLFCGWCDRGGVPSQGRSSLSRDEAAHTAVPWEHAADNF